MRHIVELTALILGALAPAAFAQRLDDAAVQAAIQDGLTGNAGALTVGCTVRSEQRAAGRVYDEYRVTLFTNRGRIALLAADAKRLGKPFAVADVPEHLRYRALFVNAAPYSPYVGGEADGTFGVPHVAPSASRVALRSKRVPEGLVQPEQAEVTPVEWNARRPEGSGVKIEFRRPEPPPGSSGTHLLARFAVEAVAALPAGDLEVVLATTGGERSCRIRAGDRNRLSR